MALFSMSGLLLIIGHAFSQERTAGGSLGNEASWNALKNLIDKTDGDVAIIKTDVNAIKDCATKGQIWQPGKGCISPGGKLDHYDILPLRGSCTAQVQAANTYVGASNLNGSYASNSVTFYGLNGEWELNMVRSDCSPMSNKPNGTLKVPKTADNAVIKGFYKY